MNCYTSGILGLGMLFATYSTVSISNQEEKKLLEIFPPELDKIYIKIAGERANIYFQGLIFGLVISYLLLNSLKLTNSFHKATFFLAITLIISVLYYLLMPKSDYMLNHLQTQEQNKAWLEVYKNMQKRYILGFIIGCLSAIPISRAVC